MHMTPKSLFRSLLSNAQHTSNSVHVKSSVSKSSSQPANLLFLFSPISVVKTKLHSWHTQLSVETLRLNDSPTSLVLRSMNTVKFWGLPPLRGSHFHILQPFHHYSHHSSWSPQCRLPGKKQKSNFPYLPSILPAAANFCSPMPGLQSIAPLFKGLRKVLNAQSRSRHLSPTFRVL